MAKVVTLPVPVSTTEAEHARSDTERNRRLFAWALAVLVQLGDTVTFDANRAEVILAIRDALHPESGRPQDHFRGLTQGGLKLILRNRFAELKKARLATLRQRHERQKQAHWSDQLILNENGKTVANIANLILMLQAAPKWKGVLAYDEFAARVVKRPQGKQKSEALRTLAVNDEWFTDRLSNISGKDCIIETAGVLIVEIAEMDALTKATTSATKAFLSRRYDRFRPPWGKHSGTLPRRCVFAGSINPAVGGYLKDPTGARRFWPVACQGMIDRDGLEEVRDQLWAEAVYQYKSGARWWLDRPELEALANAEQAARFLVDVWEGIAPTLAFGTYSKAPSASLAKSRRCTC
jgi:hypothetical protein